MWRNGGYQCLLRTFKSLRPYFQQPRESEGLAEVLVP
jgi:hypothetical protein